VNAKKSSIPHSLRSATMGSTPAARHAGVSNRRNNPNVCGSLAGSSLKPFNNSLCKKFINSSDDRFVAFAVGKWTAEDWPAASTPDANECSRVTDIR
jgi:hypothetical protein